MQPRFTPTVVWRDRERQSAGKLISSLRAVGLQGMCTCSQSILVLTKITSSIQSLCDREPWSQHKRKTKLWLITLWSYQLFWRICIYWRRQNDTPGILLDLHLHLRFYICWPSRLSKVAMVEEAGVGTGHGNVVHVDAGSRLQTNQTVVAKVSWGWVFELIWVWAGLIEDECCIRKTLTNLQGIRRDIRWCQPHACQGGVWRIYNHQPQ